MTDPTVYRRKRRPKEKTCRNEMVVKWLEEWRDQARENGSSAVYSYNKAIKSVKAYPLPITSGEEARILDGVGDKIVKLLTKKFADCKSAGSVLGSYSMANEQGHPPVPHKQLPAADDNSYRQTKKGKSKGSSSSPGTAEEPHQSNASKAKRKRSTKEYVPTYRSGGYAILVALFKAEELTSFKGYLTKKELIDAAQELCDSSFTIPSDANMHYTAWASATTLRNNGLLIKKGSPARYSLSDKGVDLAQRLLASNISAEETQSSSSSSPISSPEPSRSMSTSHQTVTCRQDLIVDLDSSSDEDSYSSPRFSHFSQKTVSAAQPSSSGLESCTDYGRATSSSLPTCSQSVVDDHLSVECATSDVHSLYSQTSSSLKYWYVDPDGKCVLKKDKAAVTFDSAKVYYLTKCFQKDLLSSGIRYKIDSTRKSHNEYIFAYIQDEYAVDLCSGLPDKFTSVDTEESGGTVPQEGLLGKGAVDLDLPTAEWQRGEETTVVLSDSDEDLCTLPLVERLTAASRQRKMVIQDSERYPEEDKSSHMKEGLEKSKAVPPAGTKGKKKAYSIGPSEGVRGSGVSDPSEGVRGSGVSGPSEGVRGSGVSGPSEGVRGSGISGPSDGVRGSGVSDPSEGVRGSGVSDPSEGVRGSGVSGPSEGVRGSGVSETGSSQDHPVTPVPSDRPLFTLYPGKFQILLIIDNQETTTKSMFRGVLLKELSKYGVRFQVRKLQVGDFLWVAQEDIPCYQPGRLSLPEASEIVLEYIIERKRMDDLSKSILDKRFSEQKFRMNNCSLPKPIYLVEQFGDGKHFAIPEKSLNQAIANTQIIDGFHIMLTENILESVAYLTLMTRYLQSYYSDKILEAHSLDYFSTHHNGKSGVFVPQTRTIQLPRFKEFNDTAVKSKALSITEMFARQLMQISGVGMEKAAAIIEAYSTPISLFNAYSKCKDAKEKELLLSTIKWGTTNTKRFIGPVISKKVYQLFGS